MNINQKKTLRELREEKVVSRADVAKAIGKTTSYYGMIENGDRIPSLPTAIKIAEYFNVPIEKIFFELRYNRELYKENNNIA